MPLRRPEPSKISLKRSKKSPRCESGAFLLSFKPLADDRSRVLILGTMPGPVALKKREYYGFSGNHFWPIMFRLFGERPHADFRKKKALLRENRIALWDVIGACRRTGASDSSIRDVVPNDIPGLIRRRKSIRTIFLNGKTAERLYRRHFGELIHIPAYALPSTSPAHASMSFEKKLKAWEAIKPFLANRNPWC